MRPTIRDLNKAPASARRLLSVIRTPMPVAAKPLLGLPSAARVDPRPRPLHVLPLIRDVIETIFELAYTADLRPSLDDRNRALADVMAERGDWAMRRNAYLGGEELEDRAHVVALMRLCERRWRVWDFEGSRPVRRPNVMMQARRRRRPTTQQRPQSDLPEAAPQVHSP